MKKFKLESWRNGKR